MMRNIIVGLIFIIAAISANAQTVCGINTSFGLAAQVHVDEQFASALCTPAINSSVINCQIYVPGGDLPGTGQIACAVYDSTGAGGSPGNLLCSGTDASVLYTVNNFYTVPLSACPTLTASTNYWVTSNHSGTVPLYFGPNFPPGQFVLNQACCTFLSSMSGSIAQNFAVSQYINITSAAVDTQIGGFIVGP